MRQGFLPGQQRALRQAFKKADAFDRFRQRTRRSFLGLGLLAVGTQSQVVEYRNLPQVIDKLEQGPEPYDACFVPRRTHYTGDVRIHDIAYAGGRTAVLLSLRRADGSMQSQLFPLRADGPVLGAPIAAPTQRDLPEAPAPCSARQRADTSRVLVPWSPGRRRPVVVHDAVEPLRQLPKMAVPEFMHERRALDVEVVARAQAHRMLGATGVADGVADECRHGGFGKPQARSRFERCDDACAVLFPDGPVGASGGFVRGRRGDELGGRLSVSRGGGGERGGDRSEHGAGLRHRA